VLIARQGTVLGGNVHARVFGPFDLQVMKVADVVRQVGASVIAVDATGNPAFVTLLRQALGNAARVVAVNFAARPMHTAWYANRRAEMHDLFRLWLASPRMWGDPQVSIPDDDRLVTQMAAYQWAPGECKRSPKGALTLTSKDYISENYLGGESPDDLDAAVLTFAVPDAVISRLTHLNNEMLMRTYNDRAA
jgi:hypothetical protein